MHSASGRSGAIWIRVVIVCSTDNGDNDQSTLYKFCDDAVDAFVLECERKMTKRDTRRTGKRAKLRR